MKKKKESKKNEIATRQAIIAQILEYNLYFNKKIKKLHGGKVDNNILYDLRKDLKEKGIADLSSFWDAFLYPKILYPNFKLSKIMAGGMAYSSTKLNNGDYVRLIYVYPETTERDVVRAFKAIQTNLPEKYKVQPLGSLGEEVYDIIFEGLQKDMESIDIYKKVKDVIDPKRDLTLEPKTINRIIRKMQRGL